VGIVEIAIVFFLILLVLGLPVYPYSRTWGYGPAGGLLTIIVVIFLLAYLTGRL
jgi:hypothetical protein